MPRLETTTLAQPIFDETSLTPDPTRFTKPHPSDTQLYKELGNLLKKDVVGFQQARGNPDDVYTLQNAFGAHGKDVVKEITNTKQIVFHAAGDTGASNEGRYRNEIRVADQVSHDCHVSDPSNRPQFFYHLGDIVYDFAESPYWYDQFYEPYRNYPAPIFAIAGNHDSFVVPNTPPGQTPLEIFQRNFCALNPGITLEAASLHRTSMTQPGVYFALDAPFVRIIGLFSNALEDPGVISSQGGKWPGVPDYQLEFLSAQLRRIRKEKYAGAVLLAVHHPPFSYSPAPHGHGTGGNHGSSIEMLGEIDKICKTEGVYPHAILSGHAHNYQRYTRTIKFSGKQFEVPFVVCGDGGHNVNPLTRGRAGHPAQEPPMGCDVSYMDTSKVVDSKKLVLEKYDDRFYGYLRVKVDKSHLRIAFHNVGAGSFTQSRYDMVTIDLDTHRKVAN